MLLTIKVIPRAKKIVVLPQPDGSFIVRLTAPPSDNQANEQLIKVLSDYFDVPKSHLYLIRGAKSHHKVVEVKK